MIVCPNCGKPVSGTARACGYCGISLVQDYFGGASPAAPHYPHTRPGSIASMILGLLAGICVIAAAMVQIAPAILPAGSGPYPYTPDVLWWARTLSMIFFGTLFFIQQIMLHGLRFSLAFDSFWLFASVFGFGLTLQGYLTQQELVFYGSLTIPLLLGIGCLLGICSCMAGILSYRRP